MIRKSSRRKRTRNTRSQHRRSTIENAFQRISSVLDSGKPAVMITGAGLSVASGIPTFRGAANSVWATTVMEWGTRRKFVEDPVKWYNTFWIPKHHQFHHESFKPNAGHMAILALIRRYPNLSLITQNVDALHLRSGVPPDRLVEVHGRLGLHKCITPGCRYSQDESISSVDYVTANGCVKVSEQCMSGHRNSTPPELLAAPKCPECGNACLPQSLFFDELYKSHNFYQWDKVRRWMSSASLFMFVGTSFAVTVTTDAVACAIKSKALVANFNIVEEAVLRDRAQIDDVHVQGGSEVALPLLAAWCAAEDKESFWDRNPRHALSHPKTPSKRKRMQRKSSVLEGMLTSITWVQCDKCNKWRKLKIIGSASADLPERWYCHMNTGDPKHQSCDADEESWVKP